MERKATSIANSFYTSLIDLEDIGKMLKIVRLPDYLNPLFITIVVRDDDWYPTGSYKEEGWYYLTLNIAPEVLSGMGSESVTVVVKDELLKLVNSLGDIEEREAVI